MNVVTCVILLVKIGILVSCYEEDEEETNQKVYPAAQRRYLKLNFNVLPSRSFFRPYSTVGFRDPTRLDQGYHSSEASSYYEKYIPSTSNTAVKNKNKRANNYLIPPLASISTFWNQYLINLFSRTNLRRPKSLQPQPLTRPTWSPQPIPANNYYYNPISLPVPTTKVPVVIQTPRYRHLIKTYDNSPWIPIFPGYPTTPSYPKLHSPLQLSIFEEVSSRVKKESNNQTKEEPETSIEATSAANLTQAKNVTGIEETIVKKFPTIVVRKRRPSVQTVNLVRAGRPNTQRIITEFRKPISIVNLSTRPIIIKSANPLYKLRPTSNRTLIFRKPMRIEYITINPSLVPRKKIRKSSRRINSTSNKTISNIKKIKLKDLTIQLSVNDTSVKPRRYIHPKKRLKIYKLTKNSSRLQKPRKSKIIIPRKVKIIKRPIKKITSTVSTSQSPVYRPTRYLLKRPEAKSKPVKYIVTKSHSVTSSVSRTSSSVRSKDILESKREQTTQQPRSADNSYKYLSTTPRVKTYTRSPRKITLPPKPMLVIAKPEKQTQGNLEKGIKRVMINNRQSDVVKRSPAKFRQPIKLCLSKTSLCIAFEKNSKS